MTEHVHIVRKRKPGEPIPSYSTAALLYGVTFPAPLPQISEPTGPEPKTPKAAMSWRRCEKNHDRIAEMIKNGLSNQIIGTQIGVSRKMAQIYISNDEELKQLSDERATRVRMSNMRPRSTKQTDKDFATRYGIMPRRLVEMHDQGASYAQIAQKVGINRYTIRRKVLECRESTES